MSESLRSIDDEYALFEKELHSLGNVRTTATPTATTSAAHTTVLAGAHPVVTAAASVELRPVGPMPPLGPIIAGPMLPVNGHPRPPFLPPPPPMLNGGPPLRPGIPPFLPHVMMRPHFLPPPPNLAMRFLPPPIRLPAFLRPPMQPPLQPTVLESGPNLYEDAVKKPETVEKEKKEKKEKDAEPGPSTMKTQVLSSDMELVAQKKHSEAANRSSFIGQVIRGEKKMKRFLRCGGGQVWEDNSLAEWDPNDFRIFCGDLGNEVSDELLAKAFRKYPSFQKAKVIRESRTNKSKGYGFVSFKHQDDFVRACREMDGKYVGNRPIKLRKSNWKERSMDVIKKKKKQKVKLGMV